MNRDTAPCYINPFNVYLHKQEVAQVLEKVLPVSGISPSLCPSRHLDLYNEKEDERANSVPSLSQHLRDRSRVHGPDM